MVSCAPAGPCLTAAARASNPAVLPPRAPPADTPDRDASTPLPSEGVVVAVRRVRCWRRSEPAAHCEEKNHEAAHSAEEVVCGFQRDRRGSGLEVPNSKRVADLGE